MIGSLFWGRVTLLLSLNPDSEGFRQRPSGTLLLPEGGTFHVASRDAVATWDLNQSVQELARPFAKAEFKDLLKQACRMGHGRRSIRKGEWFEKTDRPEQVPVYTCGNERE